MQRRQLLKMFGGLGLWASPMASVFSNIALGQSTGYRSRRYLGIQQGGAPSRWTFDLFLNPKNSNQFEANPGMGTRYTSSDGKKYDGYKYETTKIKNINVPYLWQFPLPHRNGGERPMGDLMDSLLVMQGINTGNPGHPGSQKLHFRANGSLTSLPAMAADNQDLPISAIQLGTSNYDFSSLQGLSPVGLGFGGNLLEKVLNPFNSKLEPSLREYRDALKSSLELVREALNKQAIQENPKLTSIIKDKREAERLIERGFDGLSEKWLALYSKYKTLVQRAINPNRKIAGINDLPIGISVGSRSEQYFKNGNIVEQSDIRELFTAETMCSSMVESFAVAEYLMTENLTGTINVGLKSFDGNAAMNFDEHQSGVMVTTLINSMYNRALASCLLELIDQLKARDMFKGTIIEISGEFNRSPKVSGFGSDHGYKGKSVAIYSGDIRGPHFIGNLAYDPSGNNRGHWGHGGEVAELGEQLSINHWAASSAMLLGVDSPISSSNSVIQELNGILEPAIGETQIIGK